MSKRLREVLLAVGGFGLLYEIVLQGGARPEIMTALISLIATAGAIRVDESRQHDPYEDERPRRRPRRRLEEEEDWYAYENEPH